MLCLCSFHANAIRLNNAEYTIDTVSLFPAGPGATYYQLTMRRADNGGGRLDCFLMTVDTRNPYVSIEQVLGRDAVIGTERPSAMAVRKSTDTKIFYGGTNGDFFATQGDVGRPTGLTVVNNEFAYTQAANGHRIGAVDEAFHCVLGNAMSFSGKLLLSDTTLSIAHVNYSRKENELVLYNQHNAATTLTNSYGVELAVELLPGQEWHTNGSFRLKVTAKEDGVGSMAIPAGKAVLSGHGTMAEQLRTVNVGDTVTVKLALKIDGTSYNLSQSIGADNYCLIVDNGQVTQANFWNELHPRTAFGSNQAGDILYFLVVDGRGQSVGCNTKDLGEIMHYYGAWKAVNWDGGGSSCLYIRPFGEVNHGSDGSERAVGNAMFAVANIPEADNTIASIAAYNPIYSLPRYGIAAPQFLGYNQYGVLIDTDVQGVMLSCDSTVGQVLPDGRFLASGLQGGALHAALGDIQCDLQVRLITSAPIAIRLDSVLRDSFHPYEVEVFGTVGNNSIQLLAEALDWTSLDPDIAVVDDAGRITGVSNGYARILGTLGDFSDTIAVRVEIPESSPFIWNSFMTPEEWTITSTSGFEPQLIPLEADTLLMVLPSAELRFTYKVGRSPFLKLEHKAPIYSLPDTILLCFRTDALFSKVNIGIRPNNASQAKALVFYAENGVPQNTLNQIAIPVEEVFGSDAAIFPLWFEYVNFMVDTKTTAASHTVSLCPITLVYNAYHQDPVIPEGIEALQAEGQTIKMIENGHVFIIRNGRRYTILGQTAE